MHDLQPLLVLLIFVPTLLAAGLYAVLVMACLRWTRLDPAGARAIVATGWLAVLSVSLWIGCDYLMSSGAADNGAPFAAILVWVVVVLPAPFLGSWIVHSLSVRADTLPGPR